MEVCHTDKTSTNKKCINKTLYTRASWKKLQSNNYSPENAALLKSKCLTKILFTLLAFNFKRFIFLQFLKEVCVCSPVLGIKKKNPQHFKVLHKVAFIFKDFKMLLCITYFGNLRLKNFYLCFKTFYSLPNRLLSKVLKVIWIYETFNLQFQF